MRYSYDRSATTKRLDLSWVEGLRKDFLTLLKNLPRIKDYKDAHKVRSAIRVYRTNFDSLFFERFLNHDLKYESPSLSENDVKYIDRKLRKSGWDFSSELSGMPIGFTDDYHSEEQRFRDFERESPQWKTRMQRKAQIFWKDMKEILEWFQAAKQQPGFDVKIPAIENTVIEGFKIEIRGFDVEDPQHEKNLGMVREGMKRYRHRASVVAPILLRKQCPIELEFEAKLDKGGEYSNGVVTFWTSSLGGEKGPDWVVHALAHEMGHHLWKTYLSKEAQDFWYATIRGDFGELNLAELLAKWPGDAWAFQFPKLMADTDPILALQVDSISQKDGNLRDLQSKEDFQRLFDSGERTIQVPKTPITGYANKNPEEAFCEALGLLVAYGSKALHERVRWWLRTVAPGAFKTAHRRSV